MISTLACSRGRTPTLRAARSSLRSLGLCVALTAVPMTSVALGPVAAAQRPDEATARARARFAEGVRLFEAGDYGRALDAFRAAYAARPHPSVLVNIANCHMQLGHPTQAVEQFSRYLQEAGDALAAERRAEIEQALGEARAAVGRLEIVASPDGATVFVDGDQIGSVPIERPIEVDPGPHVVEVRTSSGATSTVRVAVSRGESARVRVGGAVAVPAPTRIVPTPVGPQAIDEERATGTRAPWRPPGAEPAAVPTTARSEPSAAPSEPAAPSPPRAAQRPSGGDEAEPTFFERVPTLAWVAGGVGIVLVGIGIGFGAAALGEQSDFDAIATQIESGDYEPGTLVDLQARGRDASDAQARDAVIADVTLALGLVAAGTTVTLVVLEEGRRDDSRADRAAARTQAHVSAGPLRGGAMLSLDARF